MQYLGGKSRLAKKIAAILEEQRPEGARFMEPFCGALNVTAAMTGERVASDGCAPLIALYRAWAEGWRPPSEVSEDLYREIKARQDPRDPLTAFVGFGCSFSGRWFEGYARSWVKSHSLSTVPVGTPGARCMGHAGAAGRSLARKMPKCEGVTLLSCDFAALEILPGDLVYCDPPYAGTTQYGFFRSFDQELYQRTARGWSALGAHVYASEYTAHPGFEEVARFEKVNSGTLNKDRRAERLFRVHP